MQRLKVRYRKSASDDLTLIGFHLRNVGASPTVVRDYLSRIRETCHRIGDAPEGGRVREDLRPGLRMWTFERRVVIFYIIDGLGVRIVNVLSKGRDIEGFYARPENPSE